jgi:hypothetical protein
MSPDEMDLEQAVEWLDRLGDYGRYQLALIVPPDKDEIERLHYHAPRMVKVLQLVARAKEVNDDPKCGDIAMAVVTVLLAELADPQFLRDMQRAFNRMAERGFTLKPVDREG